MKQALWAAAATVAVLVIVVGGYLGGWWLRKDVTDRSVSIDNRQKGTQTAWHDEAIDLFNQADLIDGTPQADALRRQACQLSARLTEPYRDQIVIDMEAQHC